MFKRLARTVAATLSTVLVTIGLTVFNAPAPASALNGNMFDPGLIISDSVFFDFGTMTVPEIQRFLDSKVPVCAANDGGPTCLRYYKTDTPAKTGEAGRCTSLPAKKDQSAAQIIYDVAHACGINPRALIVILQKEQGLIQARNPTDYMYRAAFGYGCPDSDPGICGKVWVGLFNQMYRAAGQLQWYGDPNGSFTYLKPGKNVSVLYNPKSSCGKKTFLMKSQATANLYYYTPYTPNEAALKNLYGSGDGCSAYGNRNFWRFYSDWFGSPIGGGFLLKSETSETYLIVDEKKYLIADPALLASLAPLGPLGVISDDYLNSFKDAGVVNKLVKSATGTLYLVDSGKRYTVSSCAVATQMSLDCTTAVTLTSSQLSALPSGGSATALVSDSAGNRYLIVDGLKRQVLDNASVTSAGLTLPALSKVSVSAFSDLPWGDPIAMDGSLFKNSTTGKFGVYAGGFYVELDTDAASELAFSDWFTPSDGTLTSAGLSAVYTNSVVKPIVQDSAGQHWLIGSAGKQSITNGISMVANAPEVSAGFLAKIPSVPNELTAPLLVRSAASTAAFLVVGGQKRPVATSTDLRELKTRLAASPIILSESALKQIPAGTSVFAPNSVLVAKTSKAIYLVDGYRTLVAVQNVGLLEQLGILTTPRKVADAQIAEYKSIRKYTGLKVVCNGLTYVASDGVLHELDSTAIAAWPGGSLTLNASTCLNFDTTGEKIGQLIKYSGSTYHVLAGKRHLIKSNSVYNALVAGHIPFVMVANDLVTRIPLGDPAKAPSTTPVTPPTPGKTYTVVSGDTLGGIATRYKTTVAKLKTLNKLTSDNIRVGQVLVLP
jgi:LysM repeat protein